jgi:hypothetical protein
MNYIKVTEADSLGGISYNEIHTSPNTTITIGLRTEKEIHPMLCVWHHHSSELMEILTQFNGYHVAVARFLP